MIESADLPAEAAEAAEALLQALPLAQRTFATSNFKPQYARTNLPDGPLEDWSSDAESSVIHKLALTAAASACRWIPLRDTSPRTPASAWYRASYL